MKMILSGVLHMHENGIVHRDLKPANLLIDSKFELNIIDFGMAFAPQAKQKSIEKNTLIGTPMYMAPEIFAAEGHFTVYKKPIDIYACGMMMY